MSTVASKLNISKVGRVCVTVADTDRAIDFYTGKLGFEKVVCFFKDAGKFKDRYATFGFNDKANLDDGSMWPTSYALTRLTKADEAKIAKLVKQAVS